MSLPVPPKHCFKKERYDMKKRFLTATLAGLLSAGMVMSAVAAPDTDRSEGGAIPYSEGTDVYAGVILEDPDAKLRVYVPTLFAFVVNGSVDTGATDAISVENNNLLLPNVKVAVNTEDGNDPNHDYSIETVGEGHMYFENCSTAIDGDERVGIPVSIKGSIKNEGTAASRNYWEHVGRDLTTDKGDFKKYRLSVDGIAFSEGSADGFTMKEAIALEAPDLGQDGSNLDKSGYAIVGSQKDVEFGVEVGGQQNHYQQVEESAKVGNIVWTISYDIANNGDIDTAPQNLPQETPAETQAP